MSKMKFIVIEKKDAIKCHKEIRSTNGKNRKIKTQWNLIIVILFKILFRVLDVKVNFFSNPLNNKLPNNMFPYH
jgi:hypothetical protein